MLEVDGCLLGIGVPLDVGAGGLRQEADREHRQAVICGAASIVIAAPFRSITLLTVVIWRTRPPLIAAAFLLTPSLGDALPDDVGLAGAPLHRTATDLLCYFWPQCHDQNSSRETPSFLAIAATSGGGYFLVSPCFR